jgi:hypothetical protein
MIRRAHCPDTDSLVSFLYDEFDGSETFDRRAIARHLDEGCDRCAAEVTSLGGIRTTLKEWAAPEMSLGFRVVNDPPRRSWGMSWLPAWTMPALPLAAAAVLVLGAALGLARFDVQYDANGFRVRTGWGHASSLPTQAAASPSGGIGSSGAIASGQTAAAAAGAGITPTSLVAAPGAGAGQASDPHALLRPPATGADAANAPWRAELMALERQLRLEMAAARQGGGGGDRVSATNAMAGDPSTPAETAFLRRVQQLIDQSEVRQQQNLALRAAELSRDFDLQRRSDQVRVEQVFGRLNEQRAQDEQRFLNAIRVSQQQP